MKRKNIVFFWGPIPKKGQPPFGGGEVGNLRTIEILQSAGYDVRVIRRLGIKASLPQWVRKVSFPFRVGIMLLTVVARLLFSDRKSIVHISGFYGGAIIIELMVLRICKLFGYKVVYEVRGGGMVEFYQQGSQSYRRKFEYIIKNSDFLFSQGKENYPLLRSISDRTIFYYPNFVDDEFLPDVSPQKENNQINLIYFGRIEPDKNSLLVVEIASELQKELGNVVLTMVGNGVLSYIEQVQTAMKNTLADGTYMYFPGCKHDELKRLLVDKHFFVFPTVREGHSNALTEAMSFGVVPVASRRGFNATVVGNDGLIVDEFEASKYVKAILEVVRTDRFGELSLNMFNRVRDNYTKAIVSKQLICEYQRIFKSE